MQPDQGRTSLVCQSHIVRPGRHDTDEEKRDRELDQACQDTCHQAQLKPLGWYCHCPYRGAGALSKVSVASPIDGIGAKHSNSVDFCLNPHVLSTISLQKLRNAPQSVSSLLTSIPLIILGLLLHVYDSRQERRGWTRYVDGTSTSEVTPVTIRYIHPPHHGYPKVTVMVMNDRLTALSFHVNQRLHPHSSNKAISNFDL